MKLSRIAQLVQGSLEGDDLEISGLSNLDKQLKGTIAYADSKKNLHKLAGSEVSALILTPELEYTGKPVIRVTHPKIAFSQLLRLFSPYQEYAKGVYPQVYIDETAHIGRDVTIMPMTSIMKGAVIGDNTCIYPQVFIGQDVKIGRNCTIKAGVKIDDHTLIGDNVIIHHNSVLGGEGFGYIQQDGRNIKVPQIGNIIIEDDVEIGSCVTIDRSTIGSTLIKKGVKIDNLVQIAHNVTIDENCIFASQSGIAGSSTMGKNCFVLGQVGIADHVTIGDHVTLLAQAGVDRHKIDSHSVLRGTPARDMMFSKRIDAAQERLPEILKIIKKY